MKTKLFSLAACALLSTAAFAQSSTDTVRYAFALPSLRLTPDARFSGMCNVGIAMPADPNSMHFNPSNIVFSPQKFNFGLSYSPNLGSPDQYINYFSLFGKLGKKNALGGSMRFSSDSMFVDTAAARQQANTFIEKQLNKNVELNLALAHKFGEGFSAAASVKYILSSFNKWKDSTGMALLSPSNALAMDLSATYEKKFVIGSPIEGMEQNGSFRAALAVSNIGTKLEYTPNQSNGNGYATYLPTNLGLGMGFTYHVTKKRRVSFAADFNKLLVPEVSSLDVNNDGVPDYQQMKTFEAMLSSLQDDPNGVMGELKNTVYSIGMEFALNKALSLRLGHQGKDLIQDLDNRLAAGIGFHISVFTINGSFARELDPNSDRIGTANVSVLIDLSNIGKSQANK